MALIKCSECGHEISDKALQCIHCGCPIESQENNKTFMEEKNNSIFNTNIIEDSTTKEEVNLGESNKINNDTNLTNNNVEYIEKSIEVNPKKRNKEVIIVILVILIILVIVFLFIKKYAIGDEENTNENVCIENKTEDVYAIKITATDESYFYGDIFSQRSTDPKYFVKKSQVGDIYLVNYRINYENTDICDGDRHWYSVTINEIEQFIVCDGNNFIEELTKEEYDAEMSLEQVQDSSTNSNNNFENSYNNQPTDPSKPTYEITSIDGNGWEFSTYDDEKVCHITDFNVSLEETIIGIQVNYSYKIINTNNPNNFCSFDIYLYDEEGYEIANFPQAHDLAHGDSTKYKHFGYIYDSTSTKFSVKLK